MIRLKYADEFRENSLLALLRNSDFVNTTTRAPLRCMHSTETPFLFLNFAGLIRGVVRRSGTQVTMLR